MSAKPDFAAMSKAELRAYVLDHRDDQDALHIYLDRLHSENPNSRMYQPEDNVAEAIAEHLTHKTLREA